MPKETLPDWERVLASAAHLQRILPDAVLVGGSATVIYAKHRLSADTDHILIDLKNVSIKYYKNWNLSLVGKQLVLNDRFKY